MKNIDIVSKGLNVIVGIIYIPISFFSWIFMMASDGTIDATNTPYINLLEVFCVVAFLVPFLCLLGVVFSAILRKKGKSICSLIVLFLPLVLFVFNMFLLGYAEKIIK